MKCQFNSIGENHYKCSKCGFELKINQDPSKIHRNCVQEEQRTTPNLVEKASNFAGAMVDWAKGGFGYVNDEEQNRRMEICKKCPHFTGVQCKLCGCYMNWKTRLSSSKCPDNPPRW